MKGNFNELIQSSVPVVIDAYAEWCGPCKVQSPILKELATEEWQNITRKNKLKE